jgi:hypothetical protein
MVPELKILLIFSSTKGKVFLTLPSNQANKCRIVTVFDARLQLVLKFTVLDLIDVIEQHPSDFF